MAFATYTAVDDVCNMIEKTELLYPNFEGKDPCCRGTLATVKLALYFIALLSN